MSTIYLKIKIKSLAAEQSIIRHEERKRLGFGRETNQPQHKADHYTVWSSLNTHRLTLRSEIRAAYVAYGYLRGRAYRQIEADPHVLRSPYSRPGPDWLRVTYLVRKYGPPVSSEVKLIDVIKTWSEVVLGSPYPSNTRKPAVVAQT